MQTKKLLNKNLGRTVIIKERTEDTPIYFKITGLGKDYVEGYDTESFFRQIKFDDIEEVRERQGF